MDGRIIDLLEPVTVYEVTYTQITLREPRGDIFNRLGPPRIPVVNQTAGSGYWVERDDVIVEYLKALMTADEFHVKAILQKLSLADSMRLREALHSFFETAAAKVAAGRSSSSSSAPGS